jgi:glutathione S-transferase
MRTGLAEKSVAVDFEHSFTEFYLSDSTYLGRGENCENTLDAKSATGSCCQGSGFRFSQCNNSWLLS